ncbi:neuroligin-2-like [Diadema antillarum]|uniref:neuroligin-2-like n=1 Tax=Diadema antillarum TaxID=105358 RepID=UPI003A881E20
MSPLAVMIFIHGDSYDEGTANMYDGSVLASYRNVIVITVNYRLGLFGFLSTGDSAARGNYGLMDQIAAIKWIHANIAQFGGNPDRLTLFGVGTGAASCGLLMLSNHTRGLIAGVIAQSGAAISTWALSREPARFAKYLAEQVDCQSDTHFNMVECLRNVPFTELVDIDIQSPLYMYAFSPVVDEDVIEAQPSVLWDQLIAGQRTTGRSNFAYMSGIVRNEAFSYIEHDTDVVGRMYLETFNDILDGFVQNNFGGIMKASRVIRDAIYYEYTDWGGGEGNRYTLKDSLQDLLTDHQWVAPCVQTLKLADESSMDAWFYLFPHRSRKSAYPRWAGTVHLEEVPYIFGAPVVPEPVGIYAVNYSEPESALSLALMTYWANFAKSGNPNVPDTQSATDLHRNFVVRFNYETLEEWPRYKRGSERLLYLSTNPKSRDFYRVHKISLWEELIPKIEKRFADEPPVNVPFPPGVTALATVGYTGNEIVGADSTHPPEVNSNGIQGADTQEREGFMVELSMVIAIGAFLLLLNLIVLGIVYYLRDKHKIEKRLAMKYLASQSEEKKRSSLHPQTTPDSGIGIPVAPYLSHQSGPQPSNHRAVHTPSVSRAGTSDRNHGNGGNNYSSLKYNRSPQHFGAIRRNSDGEVEFEV